MASKDSSYHILLAEDSAADVGIVRLALRDQNFDHVLHVARDGEEAIAFIERADRDTKAPGPDLLLLDMHLPLYNGEQILKRLRSTERYAQTPVVVMTSSAAPEDRDRAEKHAALYYFRKPSRLDEFIQLGAIVRDILTSRTGASGPRRDIDNELARFFGPARPLCGEFLKSAKAAIPRRHTGQELAMRQSGSRSVLREFLRSRTGASEPRRHVEKKLARRFGSSRPLCGVFLKSAKAAIPRRHTEHKLAMRQSGSRSVLREFLKSRTGASGPRRDIDKELARFFGPARPLCGEFLKRNTRPGAECPHVGGGDA